MMHLPLVLEYRVCEGFTRDLLEQEVNKLLNDQTNNWMLHGKLIYFNNGYGAEIYIQTMIRTAGYV